MTAAAGPGPVDVHAHLAPPPLIEAMRAPGGLFGLELVDGGQAGQVSIAGRRRAFYDPLLSDLDARERFLDRVGISRQLVSPWIELCGYDVAPDVAEAYSEEVNRRMAEAVAELPDRLIGLGTVPLQSGGDSAARVLRSAVLEHGLAGVQIGSHVPASSLADERLVPFWAEAERLGAIVFIHPHYAAELRPSLAPVLEFAIANPADTTLAVAQLMFSGRLAQFPRLQLLLAHGGGFLPFQLGRLDSAWSLSGRPGERSPSELFSRLYFDTVVHGPGALDLLIDLAEIGRVLMGTDYPFALGDLEPLASLEASTRARAQAESVLSGGAEGMLAAVSTSPASLGLTS